MKNRLLLAGGLSVAAAALAVGAPTAAWANPAKPSVPAVKQRLEESGRLFMENKGQWDRQGKFLARTRNMALWVTESGVVIDKYREETSGGQTGTVGHVVKMSLSGVRPGARVEGVGPAALKADFVRPGLDVRGVRTFQEAWVRGVYAGIDLRTYFQGSKARYDFVVAPGADPKQIRMEFKGVDTVKVSPKGELVVPTTLGDLKQSDLVAFQTIDGKRRVIPASFVKAGENVVQFRLGAYDRSKPLVIDPLVYGSYYGGDDGWDDVRSVVADEDGGVYFTGSTRSARFPAIYGPYGFSVQGTDAYLSRLQGDVYVHDYAAFVGGNLTDVGSQIQLDAFGNVWMAGTTQSTNFPGNPRANVTFLRGQLTATGGTFFMRYNGARIPNFGGANRPLPGDLPWNATAAQIQTAINTTLTALGEPATAVVTGGPLPADEVRIELPNAQPGAFTVTSTGLTASYAVQKRPRGQAQLLYADPSAQPSAGNFRIKFGTGATTAGVNTTANIPWNASPSQVVAALSALTDVGAGNVQGFLVPPSTGVLPAAQILLVFSGPVAGPNPRITVLPPDGADPLVGNYLTSIVDRQEIFWDQTVGSRPIPPSFFALTFENFATGTIAQTALIPFNANGAVVDTALEALANVGNNNIFGLGGPLPDDSVLIHFVGALLGEQALLEVTNIMQPRPVYTAVKPADVFALRFRPDQASILTPLPQSTLIVGGSRVLGGPANRDVVLRGFAVTPDAQPGSADPVELVFAGSTPTNLTLTDYTTPYFPGPQNGSGGFLFRVNFDRGANTFALVNPTARIMTGSAAPSVTGLALDSEGNAHVTGSVVGGAAGVDTSLNPGVFETTAGVFNFGRLLRGNDAYVRKYAPDGTLLYSVLVGGNNNDSSAGIAVDREGNAYITGVSTSFNFPRTRGVYGENFGPDPLVYVTKLNRDASEILYSTHLRTVNVTSVKGIAVDSRLNAYVTGETGLLLTFPNPPGDPNEPNGQIPSSVPTTADALRGAITSPTTPELPTNDGYLLVLNSTATNLLYGTYVGADLDEELFAPYTDKFGDVWVFGRIDTSRFYTRVSSTGAVTAYLPGGPRTTTLADAFLSPNAFRRTIDTGSATATYPYGILESPFTQPSTINASVGRDGFVIRLRIGLPLISALTVNPPSVAGGAGARTQGTVTLTSAAPQGGQEITLTLSDPTVASFQADNQVGQRIVTVAEGQTTATFDIFTSAVASPTAVDLRASLEGSFQVRRFTVAPWLNSLVLAPSTIVGGNVATGRVRLFQNAPAGGIRVQLLTSNPSLVTLPNPPEVLVPAGTDTAVFNMGTNGVSTASNVNITASFLGAGVTQTLTLTPGNLTGLVFTPTRVAGNSVARGRITLDGRTGAPFTVNLSFSGGAPSGYSFRAAGGTQRITSVTFNRGDTFKEFDVVTGYETVNTQRTIVASRPAGGGYSAQTVRGVLFVDAVTLTGLSVTPNSIAGGASAVGRVTLGSPSPTGGTIVGLQSTNTALATVPARVVIPAGATSATFTVRTLPTVNTGTVTIRALRGPVTKSATMRVRNFGISVSLNPTSVLGGLEDSTATVTITSPAPAGGVLVTPQSSNPAAASVPVPFRIPAGQRTATFPVETFGVSTTQDVTITARFGPNPDQAASDSLTVRTFGLKSMVFVPSTVQGGSTVILRVTLDAPSDGRPIPLTADANRQILQLPSSIRVTAGRTTQDFTIRTNIVPRTLSTTVTGTYNAKAATATVTVLR